MSTEDVPKEIKASTDSTDTKKDTPIKKKEITMAGKGDKPRPYSTSQEEFARKWEMAFGTQIKDEIDKDNVDRVLREVAENASESVYIPKGKNIKEIVKDIEEKNEVHLLNDNTLEAEIAKMKDKE